MAEYAGNPEIDADETGGQPTAPAKRLSVGLLLAGLAALAVSAWVLMGPFPLDWVSDLEIGWVFVVAAAVVGAVLIFVPGRRR